MRENEDVGRSGSVGHRSHGSPIDGRPANTPASAANGSGPSMNGVYTQAVSVTSSESSDHHNLLRVIMLTSNQFLLILEAIRLYGSLRFDFVTVPSSRF